MKGRYFCVSVTTREKIDFFIVFPHKKVIFSSDKQANNKHEPSPGRSFVPYLPIRLYLP